MTIALTESDLGLCNPQLEQLIYKKPCSFSLAFLLYIFTCAHLPLMIHFDSTSHSELFWVRGFGVVTVLKLKCFIGHRSQKTECAVAGDDNADLEFTLLIETWSCCLKVTQQEVKLDVSVMGTSSAA